MNNGATKTETYIDRLRSLVPLAVFLIALIVIVCIPLRVISYGFIPPDDAMRHAAKVISGKAWDQILVLRPEFRMDSHPGWHAILSLIHNATGCDQDTLVIISVISLFVLFCSIPIFFLDYIEAWLISLLALVVIAPHLILRLFLGRPFILTMSVIMVLCFLWPMLKEKKANAAVMAALTCLIAASTWIHASWYLFVLPIAAFFLSGQTRVCIRLAVCTMIGVAIGLILTGNPYLFVRQTLTHMSLAFSSVSLQRLLVTEFQPFSGDSLTVLFFMVAMLWRKHYGKSEAGLFSDPVFMLALTGWMFGFVASRFWTDWGMPAAIFWLLSEIRGELCRKLDYLSWRRVFVSLAVAAALFLAVTADVNSRWTYNLTTEYLSVDDPKQSAWLPEPGGILYSSDMTIFYQTFYKNPKAPWRYILGFEPAMMPADDLSVLRNIQWNFWTGEAYEPWVKKMRPQDRMVIRASAGDKPKIAGLDWYYAVTNTWIGRLPK